MEMKGKKREINAGRYLGWSLVASVVLGLLVASLTDGVVWFIVTSVAVAAVAFFLLFWGGVVVAAVFGMTVKEEAEPVGSENASGRSRRGRRRRRRRKKNKVSTADEISYYEKQYDEWYDEWQKELEEERKRRDDDFPKFIPFS